MLLRHRRPRIDVRPAQPVPGLEHLSGESIAILRWLTESRVDHVVVGEVARAIRGDRTAGGPVAVVPAPYRRNVERLARALTSVHARERVDGDPDTAPVKLTGEKLQRASGWALRCGDHDLDIEGRTTGVPRYEELLWEAAPFELEPGLTVQVASPSDLEHFDRGRRSAASGEIKITRVQRAPSL
jgi:hypothetical protein